MGLGGLYTNLSPPLNISPGRFDNVNNNLLYNRYNAINQYYNNTTSDTTGYVMSSCTGIDRRRNNVVLQI